MDKLDILNREEFVEKLINLTENISANKTSTSFAIDGIWGCGKSFVLDMYEEQLSQIQSEETNTDKYFIVRYNCWKRDYYKEPLIAIVSTMIETIEEKTKLFPDDEEKSKILGMFKAAGLSLLSMVNSAVKEKTGVDFQQAFQTVNDGAEEGASSYEKEHRYDVYFGFNKVMEKLYDLLQEISEQYTVVFVVDELDRCLPEYAIKVLERLHHLTEDTENIITIIAIDKSQLMSSIKQIFGFDKPEKYLEKFIQFEIKLDYGKVSEHITEKYSDYISMFDKDLIALNDSIEEFMQIIFKAIDVRTQEQLVKRAAIVHRLLYNDKKDYVFMCMELLLTVLICEYNNTSCFKDGIIDFQSLKHKKFAQIFALSDIRKAIIIQPAFLPSFQSKYDNMDFRRKQGFSDDPIQYIIPEQFNLYGAMLLIWYQMQKHRPEIGFTYYQGTIYETIADYHLKLQKFAETIQMLK